MNQTEEMQTKAINDIDMAASFITAGHRVVNTKTMKNKGRGSRYEMLFCFEVTEQFTKDEMSFVSGQLLVDAKSLLQNRASVISMTKNGQFNVGTDDGTTY